ncbi:MAG: ATP-binding cassette domain-containing protein [Candidatus Delongbacteria bacterium]|jgi:ABC-2 type transport system ATP-binding protein|nr:ATP-binding cassette domain-containing protein [Candidatus Delongbacteria bacterium]
MIKIRNLEKQYKQFNDFKIECNELDITKGEIVGIYGSVASGKTLFSKIVSGVHKKYDGLIELGMVNLSGVHRKLLSYVPSSNILYNDLTVNDHIKFLRSEFNVNKTEVTAKINWYDQFYKINSKLNRKIHTFTSGELQYIKIFLSLLHSPSILIIDELFTGLGSDDIIVFKKLFQEISEREVTILFTSSHLEYTKSLTEKIFQITNGIVEN